MTITVCSTNNTVKTIVSGGPRYDVDGKRVKIKQTTINEQKLKNNPNVTTKVMNNTSVNVRTIVSKGLKFDSNGKRVKIKQKKMPSIIVEQKSNIESNVESQSQNLINYVCINKQKMDKQLKDFYSRKQYDTKTQSVIPHLTPIIIDYYSDSGLDQRNIPYSDDFRQSVDNYYSNFDIQVKYQNDRENERWRILLYPDL